MASMRKSLFTKPAWATKSVLASVNSDQTSKATRTAEDEDVPIFSSKHIYEDIVAEEHRRREKHAQRVKERGKRDVNRKSLASSNTESHGNKRRKVSAEQNGHDDDSQAESGNETGSDSPQLKSPIAGISTSQRRRGSELAEDLTEVTTKKRPRRRSTKNTATIPSDDETEDVATYDDDDLIVVKETSSTNGKREHSEADPESEEENEFLQELKRKARAEARQKRLGIGKSTSSGLPAAIASGSPELLTPGFNDLASPEQDKDQQRHRATSTPMPDDPEIDILINTLIPNAKSLIVKRRASQPLDKLREYWCQRNELNPVIASKVFFTWNGTRLYNSTTMRGILETLKRTHPTKDGSDPSNGKIEIEAVTDEIFEFRKEQRQRRQKEAERALRGESAEATKRDDDDDAEAAGGEANQPSAAEKPDTVIRLHCPDLEPMSIRLRPHTTVAKIITAFRKIRDVDPEKTCWLSYDGDRLEPDQTAEAIGFEHEDSVDVYLR